MPEQQFRRVRWYWLSAAAFQLSTQVSERLCSLWSPFQELPALKPPEDFPSALAQLLQRVRWFQLSAAAFQLAV
jgi:hypothetical protein